MNDRLERSYRPTYRERKFSNRIYWSRTRFIDLVSGSGELVKIGGRNALTQANIYHLNFLARELGYKHILLREDDDPLFKDDPSPILKHELEYQLLLVRLEEQRNIREQLSLTLKMSSATKSHLS